MVITADARTLIVAETFASRLDGLRYRCRRLALEAPGFGFCSACDATVSVRRERGLLASPFSQELLRVREGGEILQRVATEKAPASGCALGGGDSRTLFVLTTLQFEPESSFERTGRIDRPGHRLRQH